MKKESLLIKQMLNKWYSSYSSFIAPDNVFETSNGELIRNLYDVLRSSAKMTEFIDFSCDFDASGKCSARREDNSSRSAMCCCDGCYHSIGYLHNGPPILKEDFATYEELFKEKVGFWRKDSGCSLPRELRSPTCVYYMCYGNAKRNEPIYETLTRTRRSHEKIAHHLIHLVRKAKESHENNKSS